MKDGRKLKGYVGEVNEDGFIVIDNLNALNTIPYSGVKQVTGKNNLTGKEIAIVAIAILLLIAIAASGVIWLQTEFDRFLVNLYRNREPIQTIADLYPQIIEWFEKNN